MSPEPALALPSRSTPAALVTEIACPAPADWGLPMGLGTPLFAALRFTDHWDALHRVRHFTHTTLKRWNLPARNADITTVVGELAANACLHALPYHRSDAWLGLTATTTHVICAVNDPSPQPPQPAPDDPLAERGRGLHIVHALSTRWGYCLDADRGKIVWAHLRSAE
ncbi:ATP-binding protein [Streptomyces sp. NPDC045369]|uniref:ATP-binding protein n=1 Tax=Streptomyces sp. NPDC045369 TaxID=3155732 RepID=UPI0033C3DBF8